MLFWNNLKLANRIGGGFLIVLILTTVVGVIGWNGMVKIANRVEIADDANRIIKNLLLTMNDEKNYIINGDYTQVEKALVTANVIKKQAVETRKKLNNMEDEKEMDTVIASVEELMTEIHKYADLENEKQKALNIMTKEVEVLTDFASTMRTNSDSKYKALLTQNPSGKEFRNEIKQLDDADQIIHSVLETGNFEKNFMFQKDTVFIDLMDKSLNNIIGLSKDLNSRYQTVNDKALIESIISAVDAYLAAVNKYKLLDLDQAFVTRSIDQAERTAMAIGYETRVNQKARMTSGMDTAIFLLILIAAIAIILGGIMAIFITLSITIPVRKFVSAAGDVAEGNFTTILKIDQNDEIGFLAGTFNNMTSNLADYREQVESEMNDQTHDLEAEVTIRKGVEEYMHILHSAIEQSLSIVIITDIDFHIEYINPMFTDISGYSLDEVIGRTPAFLNTIYNTPKKLAGLIENILEGRFQREIFHNKKKNGKDYWVSLSISGIKDEKGVLTNILTVEEDITQTKILKEQLIQAQKMEAIGTLAGGVAHDFNNILSIVLGYSDYLLTKFDKKDKYYAIMEDIREASKRGASLTRQLLVFSRKQPIEFSKLNLNDVISGIENILNKLITEAVNLQFNLGEKLWVVEADQSQIGQILMNMIQNSCHAMPRGGSLIISSRNIDFDLTDTDLNPLQKVGKFVSLSIKDTGCGMNEEMISKIFDPFFTTKPVGKGTGLGLSVVYGIVEQHNGWIDVKSEEGEGTEFIIYLPVFEGKEQYQSNTITAKDTATEVMKTGNGERILLVEDDRHLRDFAARILIENGYNVFSVGGVEELFDRFEIESDSFDLIFSDVNLPDINGVKLVEFLLERNPGLKVLLSSGYTDEKSHWREIQKDGYSFLQKPYTMNVLLNKIAEVLDNS